MPSRVSPTEQIRVSIDALFADPDIDLGATMEDVARLSVRLVFQAALEAEVTEFLGRDRYARGELAREGSRNGYSDVTVKTTAGPVTLRRAVTSRSSPPSGARTIRARSPASPTTSTTSSPTCTSPVRTGGGSVTAT